MGTLKFNNLSKATHLLSGWADIWAGKLAPEPMSTIMILPIKQQWFLKCGT